MAYIFKQKLVSPSKYSLKCPNPMTPEYIVVHNTANDASAENEISYMINNNSSTSYHYAIDDVSVIQGVLINRNAWHAGDGSGPGNLKGIGIEICYSLSGGPKFEAAEDNAARFIAEFLKERNWGIERVKKHQDFDHLGKYCPHRTLDMGWDRFINMIKSYLNEMEDIDMSKYEELKAENAELKKSLSSIATTINEMLKTFNDEFVDIKKELNTKKYDTLNDIPEWAKESISNFVNNGYLLGDGDGKLNLDDNLLRTFVVLDRIIKKIKTPQ